MRQLKQDLDKIGQQVMVIICLNKCDEMKNNYNDGILILVKSENESDNKNNESENPEKACQQYIELKKMFEDKIEEWQKARWQEYKNNYGMHCAGYYKMPIETMIISAKTGYNLDNVWNKLAQFSNMRAKMYNKIIGDHLNNCDMRRVVLYNFVVTICIVLGLLAILGTSVNIYRLKF